MNKIKKIGLVSIPRYYNFGTQLQLYALQTSIEALGYLCEVINYNKDFSVKQKPLFHRVLNVLCHPHRLPLGLAFRFYNHYYYNKSKEGLKRSKTFERELIHISKQRYTNSEELEKSPPQCDAFVVGSDQVWHPTGHLGENAYFLTFANPRLRIAYSPSLGVSEIAPESITWLKKGIQEMQFLSVRESTGAELIRKVSGRDAEIVVDPTLLISSEHWKNLLYDIAIPDKYVLMYALCGDTYIRRFCKKLAKQLNCSIVVLPKHARDVLWISNRVTRAFDIGPREFLGLFNRAEFVITDSFHGTVFSIQFQRPFYTFKRYDDHIQSAIFSRISDLLEKLGLQDRIVSKTSLPQELLVPVDYTSSSQKLVQWVARSRSFLSEALLNATTQVNAHSHHKV